MSSRDASSFRKTVLNHALPVFRDDPSRILLVGDMGFGAIDQLCEACPGRVVNCGMMEPGTVGIAAGMAMAGLRPVFYSIVNFLVFRSIEQIRNDVVAQGLDVKFIGTGAEDYFRFLGVSHCCGSQDIELMRMVGVEVFDPFTSTEPFPELVSRWLHSGRAGYLRV